MRGSPGRVERMKTRPEWNCMKTQLLISLPTCQDNKKQITLFLSCSMHNNNFYLIIVLCVCWNCTKKKSATPQVTYIHSLFALFFFIDQRILLKLYIHFFCILIITIPKLYGNLALEFDEDHYSSLPVKIAQQHSYVHLKIDLLKSSIRSLGGEGWGIVMEYSTVTAGSYTCFAALCDVSPSRRAIQIKNRHTRLSLSLLGYLHFWTVDNMARKSSIK